MTQPRRTPPAWSSFHPVYEAEKSALPFGMTFRHLDHVVEYTSVMLSQPWWQEAFPEIDWVWICESENKAYAWAGGDRDLHLPEFAMNESYLLHEVAHVVTPEDYGDLFHGPEFRKNHVYIIRHQIGDWLADHLVDWYERMGVPVTN